MHHPIPLELLEPPADLPDWDEVPPEIPAWMLEEQLPAVPELPWCDCGCGRPDPRLDPEVTGDSSGDAEAATTPALPADAAAGWAVPGVTGLTASLGTAGTAGTVLPPVSPEVAALVAAAEVVAAVDPSLLPPAQALADGEALLGVAQQLRISNLGRIGDVAARGLQELVGFRSAASWLIKHRPDGDSSDVRLARQLRSFAQVHIAVAAGSLPLTAARKVVTVLQKIARHVDRPDGLIDGQPGDQVVAAIVKNSLRLICQDMQGLDHDDPRLQVLIDHAKKLIGDLDQQRSQLAVLEGALLWLAEQTDLRRLPGRLDEQLMAILPSVLEQRGQSGHARRSLTLTPLPEGEGWHVCGDLDLECGERLWTALRSEAARDPRNPQDTAGWEQAREQGDDPAELWQDGTEHLVGTGLELELPRSRQTRLHDALNRLLGRYLEHGLGGVAGKVPVQIHVTLTEHNLHQSPGAPPPQADSGRLIPKAMLRRWWCDSSITAFVHSLGGKALRVIHGQRTLNGDERRALISEGGNVCAGDGCCRGTPDPLIGIRPHHILGYAEDQITSLDDTLPVCDTLHHDLHDGHKTVRLRNGRYLNEHGYTDKPSLYDQPPF